MESASRFQDLREYLRESQWFLPSLSVVVALVVGTLLGSADAQFVFGEAEGLIFAGDDIDAREILGVVAGSVIGVASLVFSITLVALQIAGQQYSPRLVSNFLRDRGNQITLSVFLATFAYSLAVMRVLEQGTTPQLSMAGLFVLVMASLAVFVYYIHHVPRSIRVDAIMRTVERRTLQAIQRNHGSPVAGPLWAETIPAIPDHAVAIPALHSGYLTALRAESLVRLAAQLDIVIAFDHGVGEQVVEGAPLAWAWPRQPGVELRGGERLTAPVNRAVRQGVERTLHQDAAYGLRQLVDIAIKSASEAVIDPTTAVDAIGHLSVLTSQLASRRLGHHVFADQHITARVAVPRRDFASYLHLACTQIRTYCDRDPFVFISLLNLLRDAGLATQAEDRHAAIDEQIRRTLVDAEQGLKDAADLALVRRAAEGARRSFEVAERSRRARFIAQDLAG